MSQRAVHMVIGRLLMDRVFRRRVERGGSAYLASLASEGLDLTRAETAALIGVDPRVWTRAASDIDRSLHGHALPDVQATHVQPDTRRTPVLTTRQQLVLASICEGFENQAIALQVGVSESAVKSTVQALFRKYGVRRRVQLVRLALGRPPLVSLPPEAELNQSAADQAVVDSRAHEVSDARTTTHS